MTQPKENIDLARAFEQRSDCSARSMKIFNGLFPALRNEGRAYHVLRELFLRPYLTSRELFGKFGVSKDRLKEVYSSIRRAEGIQDLFDLSPYPFLIKTLTDLARDGERTLRILEGETPWPLSKTMELFISASCNARCKFCYRDGKVYSGRIMGTGMFVDLVDQFADLDGENLDVSGGLEPLASPSIFQVLEQALDRKLRVTLYTNGIELGKPGLLDYLLRIDKVRVSLNASDRESYRSIMGVDRFDAVKDNLANLIRERRGSSPKVGISFVVYRGNYAKIFDAIKLALQLHIDFVDLRSVHVTNVGGFTQREQEELQSALRGVKEGILLGKYGDMSVSIADTFNCLNAENDLWKHLGRDFVDELIRFRATVSPHGKVYALNVVAQPTREDSRYLLGQFSESNSLLSILKRKKHIPFEPGLFLPHDISLMVALRKLKSDLEFGIGLEQNLFNFQH